MNITTIGLAIRQPDQAMVEEIERMLELARNGDLVAMAFAGTVRGGRVTHALLGDMDHAYALIGAIESLKMRSLACQHMVDSDEGE
jgi:hypothetical protein